MNEPTKPSGDSPLALTPCYAPKDRNGKVVKEGDRIGLIYIDPMGGINPEEIDEIVTLENRYGCLGWYDGFRFNTLYSRMKVTPGPYISNMGNKPIVDTKGLFILHNAKGDSQSPDQ